MPDEESRKRGFLAFWTTLPGTLTGLAALITAVVGAVALFKSTENGGNSSAPPANPPPPITASSETIPQSNASGTLRGRSR
jgi:hypothetical protein